MLAHTHRKPPFVQCAGRLPCFIQSFKCPKTLTLKAWKQSGVTGCKVWGIQWLWHEGDSLFHQELLHWHGHVTTKTVVLEDPFFWLLCISLCPANTTAPQHNKQHSRHFLLAQIHDGRHLHYWIRMAFKFKLAVRDFLRQGHNLVSHLDDCHLVSGSQVNT